MHCQEQNKFTIHLLRENKYIRVSLTYLSNAQKYLLTNFLTTFLLLMLIMELQYEWFSQSLKVINMYVIIIKIYNDHHQRKEDIKMLFPKS